jgi:hypothetical protein
MGRPVIGVERGAGGGAVPDLQFAAEWVDEVLQLAVDR